MSPTTHPSRRHWIALFVVAFASTLFSASAAEPGFKPIFNGKDLAGWEGNMSVWSVRDGAITGRTTADAPLKANTFLVWRGGEPENFELRASFRLVPNNEQQAGNSGIQYRSRVLDRATWVVGGYQADIDFGGKYLGMLYEEKGRGILMQPGEQIRVKPAGADGKAVIEKVAAATDAAGIVAAYRKSDWNDITIIAEGNRLRHWVNGKLSADVTDLDPAKGAKSGVIALQLHTGPPMTIQFKDVRIKMLP